jgi:pyruvate kinase
MMHSLCLEAERAVFHPPLFNELRAVTPKPTSATEAIASSAVNATLEQNAKALIVLTSSGFSARMISKYRPRVPILTVTRVPWVARQSHLYNGCYPFLYEKPNSGNLTNPTDPTSPVKSLDEWQGDVDSRIFWAMEKGVNQGILQADDIIVAIQGWRGGSGNTSVMRVMNVPKSLVQSKLPDIAKN